MSRAKLLLCAALASPLPSGGAWADPKSSTTASPCEPMPDCQIVSNDYKPGKPRAVKHMMKKKSNTDRSKAKM